MTTPAPMPAVPFEAPLVNPSPNGLYPVTNWTEDGGLSRWLGEGVEIRPHNYGGGSAFGVWGAEWCQAPDPPETKDGDRPEIPEPFPPIVVWAYDECDMTAPSRDEVRERVAQNLRLLEQTAVETELAARMLTDAGAPQAVVDLTEAVGYLEGQLAVTNTLGFIHANPELAAFAARDHLITRSGSTLRTPLGHTWVFGGGYVTGLGTTLVATSQPFGWRNTPEVRDTFDYQHNRFAAVAERAVVIGYEAAIAAAQLP